MLKLLEILNAKNLAFLELFVSDFCVLVREMSTVPASEYDEYYNFVMPVIHRGGTMIRDSYYAKKTVVTKSNILDIVTETDSAVESLLISAIKQRFPTHLFIAEESHNTPGSYDVRDDPTWIIDPVDGTNNFVHSLPHVCIAVALMINKTIVLGIVHNPILHETFHAIKGHGAYLTTYLPLPRSAYPSDDVGNLSFAEMNYVEPSIRTQTSALTILSTAAIITELGYDRSVSGMALQLERLRLLTTKHSMQSLRMYGSCAMNMCSVAMGRAEAYYEGVSSLIGPKPWDVAAASLIITESGGLLYDPLGSPFDMWSGRILCANNDTIAQQIIQTFQEAEQNVAQIKK